MASRRFRCSGAEWVDVIALEDGAGAFFEPREKAFPDATAEHWRRADALDPGAVADGRWWLRFRCFALRFDDGRVVLVDAGIGPAGSPAAGWAPVPGRLPQALAAAGIAADQVDTVVLTHMHTDHIGWAVDAAAGTGYFGNARYLMQRVEIETIQQTSPVLVERLLAPLRGSDQLSAVDGEQVLGPRLRVVPTPGHTPGHQSVLLAAEDGTVLIAGDLLVHAVQLLDPQLAYSHEVEPRLARATRVALLDDLTRQPEPTLATAHLSEPFLRIPPATPCGP